VKTTVQTWFWFLVGNLLALSPPNTKGTKDVVVINSDGQQATLANGFTYIDIGPLISGDILS